MQAPLGIYIRLQTRRHLGNNVLCFGARKEGFAVPPPQLPFILLDTSPALTLYQQHSTGETSQGKPSSSKQDNFTSAHDSPKLQ